MPARLRALREASGLNKAGFLRALGMKAAQWNRYESGERLPEGDVLQRIAEITRKTPRWILTGQDEPGTTEVAGPKQEWLDREWQETHSFTAMVEALRHLEGISLASLQAWRARVAWEAVVRAAEVVLKIADWKDKDWEYIYRRRLDHWLRPKFGKRAEQETLRERLQIELGFGEEDEQ